MSTHSLLSRQLELLMRTVLRKRRQMSQLDMRKQQRAAAKQEVLDWIAATPYKEATAVNIGKALSKSRFTIQNYLADLQREGKVEMQGTGNRIKWRVIGDKS